MTMAAQAAPQQGMFSKMMLPLAGNAMLALIGLIATRLMAGSFSPEEFGLVAYVNGITLIFLIFSDFGLGATHTRMIAQGEPLGDCLQVYFRIKLLLVAACSVLMLAFLLWHVPRVATVLEFGSVRVIIAAMTAAWALTVVYQAISYTFAGQQRMGRQIGLELLRSLTFLFCITATHFCGLDVKFLALSYLIAAGIPLLVGVYWLRDHLGSRFRWDLFHSYRGNVAPIFGYMLIQNVPRNFDGLIVAEAAGVYQTGIYYAAKRLVSPLDQSVGYLGHMLLPTLARLSREQVGTETIHFILQAERFLAALFAPVIAGAIFFCEPVTLLLLGPKYHESAPVIRLLVIAVAINLVGSPYSFLPTAIDRPILSTKIFAWSTLLWLAAVVLLVPSRALGGRALEWGALGCAIATLAMSLLQTVLERRQCAKITAGRAMSNAWQFLIPALMATTIGYFFLKTISGFSGPFFGLVGATLVMLMVYAFLLKVGQVLTPKEREQIAGRLRHALGKRT